MKCGSVPQIFTDEVYHVPLPNVLLLPLQGARQPLFHRLLLRVPSQRRVRLRRVGADGAGRLRLRKTGLRPYGLRLMCGRRVLLRSLLCPPVRPRWERRLLLLLPLPPHMKKTQGSSLRFFTFFYFAYSTLRNSRMTLTLIWPGYSSSASIFLAMSLARKSAFASST